VRFQIIFSIILFNGWNYFTDQSIILKGRIEVKEEVNFELENLQDLQMQALKLATAQTKEKAEAIADSAGEKISGLYRIREERTDYMSYVYRPEVAADMGMGDATPIMPDEVVVRAMVTAEFSF
jgi:uncharacterized protein YggE